MIDIISNTQINLCNNCAHSICILLSSKRIYRCMRKTKKEINPVSGNLEYLSYKLALNCDSEREVSKDFKEYIELLFGMKRDKGSRVGKYFKPKVINDKGDSL